MTWALVVIILALIGLVGWIEYNGRKERKSLINAILAKDTQELVNLDLVDKTTIKAEKPKGPAEELIEANALSDEEFDKFVMGGKDGE